MTMVLMGIFLLAYAGTVLFGARPAPDKESFLDLHDANMLKGLFCIIVVMVHVPALYQNRIQDMLGSFAYIGVTYYFLTSSFGLTYSVQNKDRYLDTFWRRRLPALLIPALLCNLAEAAAQAAEHQRLTLWSFININDWVKVLLLFYLLFWLIYFIPYKLGRPGGSWQPALMVLLVLACSLMTRLTPLDLTLKWHTESLGFAYGVLLAAFFPFLQKWTGQTWGIKTLALFVPGLLCGLAYLKWKPVPFFGDYLLKILLGILLTALLLQASRKVSFGNKALGFLGSVSYEVFLLHRPIYRILAVLLPQVSSGVFIWLSVLVTLLLAALIHRLSQPLITSLKKAL